MNLLLLSLQRLYTGERLVRFMCRSHHYGAAWRVNLHRTRAVVGRPSEEMAAIGQKNDKGLLWNQNSRPRDAGKI